MLRRALQRQEEIRTQGKGTRDKLAVEMETLGQDLPPLEQALEVAKQAADIEREAEAAKKAAEEAAKREKEASLLSSNCMWRQTSGCTAEGTRESANDKVCTE